MKRVILALVVIVMVSSIVPAFSSAAIDLKTMSDEELIQLNKVLIAELLNRGQSAEVPVGRYIVGEHIPSGEYTLKVADGTQFSWFETDTPDDRYSSNHQMYTLSIGETVGRVTLYDGDYVDISMGPMMFSKLTAAPFVFK